MINEAQKQRVALGRAVVCKPKVLLVDEDFARQNEYRRKEMMRDIRRINKELGITVLYVTNKRGETEIAGQKVISMRDGEIVDIKKSESHKLIVQKGTQKSFLIPAFLFYFLLSRYW